VECVPVIEPPYIFKYCENDNWSEWKEDSCKSSCLENSKGTLIKRRLCRHQTQITANCIGPYYDVVLCEDSSLCTENRQIVNEFATMKCAEFDLIIILKEKKMRPSNEVGWQASHEVDKPWKACTIFCMHNHFYHAPHLEMLSYGIDPYFPDGIWCHKEDDQDYYCRKHYCLPEYYSFK
jgi:hypothetical protein